AGDDRPVRGRAGGVAAVVRGVGGPPVPVPDGLPPAARGVGLRDARGRVRGTGRAVQWGPRRRGPRGNPRRAGVVVRGVDLPFQIGGIPDSRTASGILTSGIRNPTNLKWKLREGGAGNGPERAVVAAGGGAPGERLGAPRRRAPDREGGPVRRLRD